MKSETSVSRRFFLRTSAAIAAGAVAAPQVAPASALGLSGRAAPSDRVTVGCIGTGHRGGAVRGEFLAEADVQVIAVCDVKAWMLISAKQHVDGHYKDTACKAYKDFRELVDRKDIDAVLVASCDHWHVLHSIAAARRKKDVYCEKPMGLSMAECKALREAIHKNERVFQFGTQQRSDGSFRLACELARNEKIGKLQTINVWSPGSSPGGSTKVAPVPEGLDYDSWLGPARFLEHTESRCENSDWWFISDYALGFIAGWGIHPIDIAQWGGYEKLDCPVEVEGKGDFPTGGTHDTATNWRITLKFASGITMNFDGSPKRDEWTKRYPDTHDHGTAFEGPDGWVHVRRGLINSSPASLVKARISEGGVRLSQSPGHVRNFVDSVKSRKQPVSNIDDSVRSETLCQISEIAIRLGRKVKWNPKTETFPGDEEANKRLSRPMRAPWSLEAV